jgi:hypothetical protein
MDTVRKVGYCYLMVSNRAGQGLKVLAELEKAGVNLLAFSGFPAGGGKAQVDLVPESLPALTQLARRLGWKLSPRKRAFLVTGDDKIGAARRQLEKLAAARINVIAAFGVAAMAGRYGMILWVKPQDYGRAARALRAR